MQEYRITVDMRDRGAVVANAEILSDAFLEVHPETGLVASADLERRTLSITFSLDAENADAALDRGKAVFADGAGASGLDRAEVVGLHVEAVAGATPESESIPA